LAINKQSAIEQAKQLLRDFTGMENSNEEYTLEFDDELVVLPVGNLVGVMYDVVRDGKREKYLHEFRKSSQPILASTHDGEQLFIIGGNYKFTDAGIIDN